MSTLDDVRRVALALPGTEEGASFAHLAWKVAGRTFVWERPFSKADQRRDGPPPPGVILAARVADEGDKLALLEGEPDTFFTIQHFEGYPAVLTVLDRLDEPRLRELVTEAWLAVAPRDLAASLDA